MRSPIYDLYQRIQAHQSAPSKSYHCSCCARSFGEPDVVHAFEGKAGGLMAGLIAGAATKNVWAALGIALVGLLVGNLIDKEISPKCPLCGEILTVLLNAALRS